MSWTPPGRAKSVRVRVCRGVTCTGFLADDVFRAFRAEVVAAGLSGDVSVERAGCFARCGGGVTVVVSDESPPGGAPSDPFAPTPAAAGDAAGIVYPEVSAPEVLRIVDEHLTQGVPVAELRIARRGAKPVA